MNTTIDLHDLPPEKIKMVQAFVENLRTQSISVEAKNNKGKPADFLTWELGTQKHLSRDEIYDYL